MQSLSICWVMLCLPTKPWENWNKLITEVYNYTMFSCIQNTKVSIVNELDCFVVSWWAEILYIIGLFIFYL